MLPHSLRRNWNSGHRGRVSLGLPIELWIDILREAQYDDILPSYKWLRRYSLVCRAWRPHAQQLLFARVVLHHGASHCKAFLKSMASIRDAEHAAMLQASIHILSMTLDHQEMYADILEMCPNLRELRMTLYHAAFRPHVLSRIAGVATSIKMLHVRTYHYTVLFQLLPLFHAVEVLDVDCTPAPDVFPDLTFPAPAWRLRDLRYINLRRDTHPFTEWALSGMAAGTSETLEALQVECPTFSPSSLRALGLTGLRSLSLPRVTDDDNLFPLTHLEEIYITSSRKPRPTFRQLPSGIRHIILNAIDGADRDAIVSDLRAYHERTGAGLAIITYHREVKDMEVQLDDIRALYEFCEECGIEFRLMNPPYGFYMGESIPLDLAVSVPRAMPLSSHRNSRPTVETLLRARDTRWSARRVVAKAKQALA